jgi:hypothetical protein
MFAFLVLLLALAAVQSDASAAEPSGETNALDHTLLWGRDIDHVTAIMTTKLGFQVRPGRNPGGVANRYVRMADGSYLELLGITRPDAEMDPGMLADQAALKGKPGARTFGLASSMLDRRRSSLKDRGFDPTDIFSASITDPDGAGPSKPPRWRLFAFGQQPLSSNLFFIDYPSRGSPPTVAADERIAREHPNGALALTGLWLLSADAGKDRKQLERMGFAGAKPIRFPQISASGYCVPIGRKQVLVIQPEGPGMAAEALRSGGPQIFGVSIAVMDVDRAKRRVERGYETSLPSYPGSSGESFLVPTQDDLGLLVEFHAASGTAGLDACP